jgi:alpha-glucosidase
VHLLSKQFDIPQLNRKRRIWIYLPKSYESSTKRYPVLYLQDGQNLFDQATSFSGEWDVDGTLNQFAETSGQEFIVVGIDNGGIKRLDEYSPYANKKHGGGEGAKYVRFIIETLKPLIDKAFRTKPSAEQTLVGGSSMGGLISFYAALEHPEVFGKALVFSPSFHFAKEFYDLPEKLPKDTTRKPKLYLLVGTKESKNMVENLNKMKDKLLANGWDSNTLSVRTIMGGTHSEQFWREQFQGAIEWLFHEETLEKS